MAGLPTLGWCVVLAILAASEANEMVSWPQCPCEYIADYGTCARVIDRTIPDSTQGLNVNLQNCNIREITIIDLPYAKARWVDLRRNYIQRLDTGIFRHVSSVNYISLEKNKFSGKDIHHEVFQDCKQLKGIGLSGNDMREAPNNLFQGLHNLEQLFLVATSLHKVPAFVRSLSNSTLTLLHLSNNEITLHDPNTFSSLTALNILHLDRNLIQFIPENIFQPIKNIQRLDLDYNRISSIPQNLFAGLTKLKSLHLRSNAIQYISPFALNDCNELKELDLSKNKIIQLPENFLPKTTNRFFFAGNPWQCSSLNHLLDIVKERQINHFYNATVEYTCCNNVNFKMTQN